MGRRRSQVHIAEIALAAAVMSASCLAAQTSNAFEKDFEEAVARIAATYAYFDAKATRWNDVLALTAGSPRSEDARSVC